MNENTKATTKRGLFFIGFAKIWFLVAGFLLQLLLPRNLDQASFGIWTLVLAWVSGFNNVIITGTVQTVSYFSRLGKESAEQAKKTALKMQLFLGMGSMLLLCLGAPLIARFENSTALTLPLQVASFIILFYSIYAVFVGAANGQQQFQKQAGLDIVFSVFRVGFVLVAALVTHQVLYCVGGFVAAAACITVVSIIWMGWPKKVTAPPIHLVQMLRYISWLLVYLFALNQLMFIDLYLLKKMCTDFFAHVFQLSSAQVEAQLDKPVYALTAIYGAAQTIARLPYQLMIAVTFVIFPVLSKQAQSENKEDIRRYITATLRYSLIGVGAMVIGLGAHFSGTMTLFYKPEYAEGSHALLFLLLAYTVFSMLSVVGTILNSLGHLRYTALLSMVILLITGLIVYVFLSQRLIAPASILQIPRYVQPLSLAAQGLAIGFTIGLVLFLLVLWNKYRVTIPFFSLFRVGLACIPGVCFGWLWTSLPFSGILGGKIGTIFCGVGSGVFYLIVLFLTKEISIQEILNIRKSRSSETNNGSFASS